VERDLRLADKVIISVNAVTRLERGEVDLRSSTITAVQKALTQAGVEFLSVDQHRGEGVWLTSPKA
jgi:predicted transcriptional regulator